MGRLDTLKIMWKSQAHIYVLMKLCRLYGRVRHVILKLSYDTAITHMHKSDTWS